MGGLLLIPLNVLSQFVFYGSLPSALEWVGVVVVIVGSLMFEIGDYLLHRYRKRASQVRFLTEEDDELTQKETESLIN